MNSFEFLTNVELFEIQLLVVDPQHNVLALGSTTAQIIQPGSITIDACPDIFSERKVSLLPVHW